MKTNDYSPCQLPESNINNSSDADKIKRHLDLVLLALEAIADISPAAIMQTAVDLNLASIIGDYFTGVLDSQKNSDGNGTELNVKKVKALITIICHLASQNQELIRRAVCLLEQGTEQKRLSQAALLNNYLDKFTSCYRQRISNSADIFAATLSDLAWKLLINLLFYSGNNGQSLLWIALTSADHTSNKADQS